MGTSEGDNHAQVVRVWLLGSFRVSVGRRAIREDAWYLRKAKAVVKLLALTLTAFGKEIGSSNYAWSSSVNGWLTHPAYAGSCNTASKRRRKREE